MGTFNLCFEKNMRKNIKIFHMNMCIFCTNLYIRSILHSGMLRNVFFAYRTINVFFFVVFF